MEKNGRTEAPKPEPWKATLNDIKENELDDARKTLVNSYHSYVQTHAGYIIAIMLGFFALMSSFDTFLKSLGGTIFFIILMLGLVLLGGFMILRIIYWTSYANYVTNLTLNNVINFFNTFNSKAEHPFFEKAPIIAVLQNAVQQAFKDEKNLPWFKKYALKTATIGYKIFR